MKIKKNFVQIANALIRNKEIGNGAFRVFCDLLTYRFNNGRVFPSHNTIAKDIGVDVRTVRNHVKTLKKLGLISWKKQGFSKSNEYIINDENFFTNDHLNNENSFSPNRKKLSQKLGKSFQPNNIQNNKESNNRGIESVRKIVNSWRVKQ